ncbi:MAG TPA: efflux RND transporter periplasmic adaptor subunit [Woeseiaceae bacterium]|nr:efflux RND transporter periplasmic adaptor subunit [Woeseiaceae bacterium]
MTRELGWLASAAVLVLLAACGRQDGAALEGDGEQGGQDAPPIPVEVAVPTRGDVYAVYKGTAPIEAFADADVIAKVAGEVKELLVEEGAIVTQGQVLARLDGDRLRLTLNESAARLRKLQRDYERNVELQQKGLISAGDFEKIKYEMEALEASHNLASLELDYTQIRAPIDGVVSARYIKLGSTLAVNAPVFRVTSLEPLIAYVHVPEREFTSIAAGQTAQLYIDALQKDPIAADVTRVSPVVDPATGTFKVTIEIYDEARRIKPGMFARIGIVHDRHEDALLVPRSALVEDAAATSVFVVADGLARRKPVTTGYTSDGMVEILTGLDGDEAVVTVGQAGLRPDARVEIINGPDVGVQLAGEPGDTTGGVHDAPTD